MVAVTGPHEQAPEHVPRQDTPPAAGQPPGFGERGRMRRRARFLRKARELAFRDLGGLVFDIHRFGQQNDQVLSAKLATLRQIDSELRALEAALGERRPVTVLHEVGISACPRCAAIHGGDDRFCPGCGLAFDAHAERPIATAPVRIPAATESPAPQIAAPSPPEQKREAPAAPAAPPIKPTAQPVPARAPTGGPLASEPGGPVQEDQPTKILRPPAGGA